jgi:outer membrane lipoprotein-sorting protein
MRRNGLTLLALLLPVLTGCLSHTRKLQQPKLAGTALNSDAVQLVQAINHRYDQIDSLIATVDIAASSGGVHKGQQTDYPSLPGHILFRKPQMLRVLGLVPILRTYAFDLASDGNKFTLLIPPKSRAIEGTNAVGKPSPNAIENLRPAVFIESILIRSIAPDRIVSLTNSSKTALDAKSKQLIETPQYDLTVMNPGHSTPGAELVEVVPATRVIHISRLDLMPTEQDIYNHDGEVETQVLYGPYQTFSGTSFPSTITIVRLIDEYKIALTIEKVSFNQTLPDEQFQSKVPANYKVEKMP